LSPNQKPTVFLSACLSFPGCSVGSSLLRHPHHLLRPLPLPLIHCERHSRLTVFLNRGGITFGKLVLYGLVGFGVLIFLGLLIELGSEDYDDPDFTSQIVTPPAVNPNTLAPTGNQNITMANLSSILGSSYWHGDVMGDLYFDETGSMGSYYDGGASLAVLSAANGYYFGTFSEPANSNYGTIGFVLSNNNQNLTINSLDQNGNVISSLYLNRQ